MERPSPTADPPTPSATRCAAWPCTWPRPSAGLTFVHEGIEYGFCGRGCRLEFGDDPATYLSPGYVPSM